jgi:hypothetical protein
MLQITFLPLCKYNMIKYAGSHSAGEVKAEGPEFKINFSYMVSSKPGLNICTIFIKRFEEETKINKKVRREKREEKERKKEKERERERGREGGRKEGRKEEREILNYIKGVELRGCRGEKDLGRVRGGKMMVKYTA